MYFTRDCSKHMAAVLGSLLVSLFVMLLVAGCTPVRPVQQPVTADPDPVMADANTQPVELTAPAADAATGVVLAPAGVNVRTGPGTDYPSVGLAPVGTKGEIVGVSEDGQWWVAAVAAAPNGQGWVAAAYIKATNAQDVPVIPAPPLPYSGTVLGNMTYQSEYTQDGTATLVNGVYAEPAAPGSAISTTVTLLPQYTAVGELNGQPAAAVILANDTGGSGTFVDLAVVTAVDGVPTNVATTNLGDRVKVNSVTITNNQIVVDMLTAGPDDPMCCPSQEVVQTYELQGNQLVLVDTQELGTATTATTEAADPDPVMADANTQPVELTAPAANAATGVVLAPVGVNVRTGPGTDYPIVGLAPVGTKGEIVGVSEDGQWWVAAVAAAPNGQGWVAAAYIKATNAEGVPVIPAPPLP